MSEERKETQQLPDNQMETDAGSKREVEAVPAPKDEQTAPRTPLTQEEREARRAARQAAKAAASGDGAESAEAKAAKAATGKDEQAEAVEEQPKEPSPNQPLLDHIVASLRAAAGEDAVEESYINEADGHLPVIVIKNDRFFRSAVHLKNELKLNYLINLSGVDRETHLEVVYHIESFDTNEQICVKVLTDREQPSIASVTPVWATANWQEREVYDLLGIDFPGHPDLRRIMMPDDWVGHPLRKDYEPLDPEV